VLRLWFVSRIQAQFAVAALALPLAAAPVWAGATDGSRQTVSPPTWVEKKPETRPYSLTGERPFIPTRETGRWKCELQRLGNKVQTEVCRREAY
jgi:hypothetical protein